MRIYKVYTRTGDGGETSLVGGVRVPKDSLRIESYGTLDELQAQLGVLRAELAEKGDEPGAELVAALHRVQNDLFDCGSALSTPEHLKERIAHPMTEERIGWLETTMDGWNEGLEPLASFILSGGGRTSALAHVARTVCRRAERITLALSRGEWVPREVLTYLNRLSDFLFVLARHLAKVYGEAEPLWETPLRARRPK